MADLKNYRVGVKTEEEGGKKGQEKKKPLVTNLSMHTLLFHGKLAETHQKQPHNDNFSLLNQLHASGYF
jgi:hypothetical protein